MTSEKNVLHAKKRTIIGKKVKLLRLAHILPGHIYGNTEPINIEFDEKAFNTLFKKAGETSVLHVHVEGEKEARPVLVADYSVDPVRGQITHVDLRQVNLNVKVKANVQIELTGESPAVKDGGVLISLINEIEVEALPNDLPEKFVLNISSLLKIGDEFKVSDLNYDASKVTLAVGVDVVLVEINEPKVEIEPEVVAPVEVETTVQGAKKEGGEGAEDVAADAKDAKAGAPKASPTKAPTATTKPAEKKEEK
ncbi:MAG: 50S ribosomal protein L25 [Patescibacteria group bacterium]